MGRGEAGGERGGGGGRGETGVSSEGCRCKGGGAWFFLFLVFPPPHFPQHRNTLEVLRLTLVTVKDWSFTVSSQSKAGGTSWPCPGVPLPVDPLKEFRRGENEVTSCHYVTDP